MTFPRSNSLAVESEQVQEGDARRVSYTLSIPTKASAKFLAQVQAVLALYLAHRARTAFLALSLRSSGVMAAALANPPCFAPRLPRATACGFFRFLSMLVIIRARAGMSSGYFDAIQEMPASC